MDYQNSNSSSGTSADVDAVLNQDLAHAPVSYGEVKDAGAGRWALVDQDIVLWTDDEDGAGVTWLTQTPLAEELLEHFQLAKSAGFPATVAYELAITKSGDSLKSRHTGDLADLKKLRLEMMGLE